MVLCYEPCIINEIVHPKMKIRSLITRTLVIPNSLELNLSLEHKVRF